MSQEDTSADPRLQIIMTALHSCYGNLEDPNFQNVSTNLDASPYQSLIASLQSSGIDITKTTDINDDVSVQLAANRDGDRVALELSAVGPFAAVRHLDADGRSCWVTRSDQAPTPLANLVATTVEGAGLRLLDRVIVTKTIRMQRADGKTKSTLYQALFTDGDIVP